MKYPKIAAALLESARDYPEFTDKPAEVVYKEGGLILRCQPSREAIFKMAEKFRKGGNFASKKRRTWGVVGAKLTQTTIASRYAEDPDREAFTALIKP